METKANYLAIGAATLLGFLGLIGFFVWFAQVQLDRQYARYDVLFDNVSGLSQAGEVRFNGLLVGQVLSIGLAPDGSGRVRVAVEVDAATPVRPDTRAQLQSQGVTGVSFVALTGGDPALPLLRDTIEGVPQIEGDRSTLETLVEDAPDLLAQARRLVGNVNEFVGPENQAAVTEIVRNLAQASGALEIALNDFTTVSQAFARGTDEITRFTGRLESLADNVEGSLGKLDTTLEVGTRTMTEAEQTFARATATLGVAEAVIVGVGEIVDTDVPRIVARADSVLGNLDAAIVQTQTDVAGVLAEVSALTATGNARLTELAVTIANLDGTLTNADAALFAVEAAAVEFDALVTGDGAALVAEGRAMVDAARPAFDALTRVAEEDVPAIVAEVRGAVETANAAISAVTEDIRGVTGRLEPLTGTAEAALATATETFAAASSALTRLETTLDVADRALDAADTALRQDAGPALADLRATAAEARSTMAALTADLPAISSEVRTTVGDAAALVADLRRTVASATPSVRAFADTGLPQFTRLAEEGQALVRALDALTRRIDRDPARFFLGTPAPDYRR